MHKQRVLLIVQRVVIFEKLALDIIRKIEKNR